MPIYKTHMRLHIYNIQHSDYGTYKCVAKNPRGDTDGTIRLYSEYTTYYFIILFLFSFSLFKHLKIFNKIVDTECENSKSFARKTHVWHENVNFKGKYTKWKCVYLFGLEKQIK